MEHMYLPYTTSHVNGVPQESKLATYMKRQSEGPPVVSSLAKNLSSINLNDSLSISLKKVTPEFVPRCSPSVVAFPSTSPLTVTAHNSSPTPTVPTYQEYVGGTTYFYAAPTPQQADNNVSSSPIVVEEEPVASIHAVPSQPSLNMFSGSVGHGKTSSSQIRILPLESPAQMLLGRPLHTRLDLLRPDLQLSLQDAQRKRAGRTTERSFCDFANGEEVWVDSRGQGSEEE